MHDLPAVGEVASSDGDPGQAVGAQNITSDVIVPLGLPCTIPASLDNRGGDEFTPCLSKRVGRKAPQSQARQREDGADVATASVAGDGPSMDRSVPFKTPGHAAELSESRCALGAIVMRSFRAASQFLFNDFCCLLLKVERLRDCS